MILPIVAYGDPILRKQAEPISADYPNLKQLIDDMFETMYAADGVGLAAPQIDRSIQLVVIGFRPYDEKTDSYGEEEERHVLINPEIIEEGSEKDYFNEGCLSLPAQRSGCRQSSPNIQTEKQTKKIKHYESKNPHFRSRPDTSRRLQPRPERAYTRRTRTKHRLHRSPSDAGRYDRGYRHRARQQARGSIYPICRHLPRRHPLCRLSAPRSTSG